jgi:ESF2/ABP1 family protein
MSEATGILYFSRVPRDMRPQEIRSYCSRFGEVFRQRFVAAATNTKQAKFARKRLGKDRALQFTEGWVEFYHFADAHTAAEQMNAQPVQVKRRRQCSGELW